MIEIAADNLFPISEDIYYTNLKYLLLDAFDGEKQDFPFVDFESEPDLFSLAEAFQNPEYVYFELQMEKKIRKDLERILIKLSYSEGFTYPSRKHLEDVLYERIMCFFSKQINGCTIAENLCFTEYPYVLMNLITLSITGKAQNTLHTEKTFNETGKNIALAVICNHLLKEYNVHKLMLYAIQAGMIGLEWKDTQAYANDTGIFVDTNIDSIFSELKTHINNVDVFDYELFEKMLLTTDTKRHLVFFTDDMIETVFDLKAIEAMLQKNQQLFVTVIPKDGQHGNDASYTDILNLLAHKDVWENLLIFVKQGRFSLCSQGNKSGIIDVRKLPSATLKLLRTADCILIKGCRGMEISQGRLDIPCFYAFTVIRDFNQSQTGLFGVDGYPAILKYIPPRRKLYWGFRNRKENGGNALFTSKDASILEQGNIRTLTNLHEKLSHIMDKYPMYQEDCNLTLMDCNEKIKKSK